MPEGLVYNVVWTTESAQQVSYNPRSFKRQVTDWGGQRLRAQVTIQKQTFVQAGVWRAFMLKMQGSRGTFLLNPYSQGGGIQLGKWNDERGASTLSVVSPQEIDSTEITLSHNHATNMPGALKASDWIQLGTGMAAKLHMVLDDVDLVAGSNVTVDIWPRAAPTAVGSQVITQSPRGVFYFAEPTASWAQDALYHHDISFTAFSL